MNLSLCRCCVFGLLLWLLPGLCQAATFTLTTTTDGGEGSLRQAIAQANSNDEDDVIHLPAGTYTLTSPTERHFIIGGAHKVSIQGSGADVSIIDAESRFNRIFLVQPSAQLELFDLSLRNGLLLSINPAGDSEDTMGGAVLNYGVLTIDRCHLSNNRAHGLPGAHGVGGTEITRNGGDGEAGGVGQGGAIYNSGTLTIINSSLSGNFVFGGIGGTGGGGNQFGRTPPFGGNGGNGGAGGAGQGGAIFTTGQCAIINCTFSGNLAQGGWGGGGGRGSQRRQIKDEIICYPGNGGHGGDGGQGQGGAIYVAAGTVTLNSDTITANSATGGSGGAGGIAGLGATNGSPGATGDSRGGGINQQGVNFSLRNSIVAVNQAEVALDVVGTFSSQGYNLIGQKDGSSGFGAPGDKTGSLTTPLDPELGPLQNNGGPTPTCALSLTSLAVDAGSSNGLALDQRGSPRPQNVRWIANVADGCDIGAYELIPPPTFTLSGRISNKSGVGLSGIAVALSKNAPAGPVMRTQSNSAGYYTFSNILEGSYHVTLDAPGYTAIPASRMVTVSNTNLSGLNFVLTPPGYTVSGRIATGGIGMSGVAVRLDNGLIAQTNSAGYYTFSNMPDGNISITPAKSDTIFTPASRTVAVAGADISNQNFIGTTGYTIIGRIATSTGISISGVMVTLDGGVTVQTNSAGYYTMTGVANGIHTLVPSKNGFMFAPATKGITVNGANVSGQNFIGSGP